MDGTPSPMYKESKKNVGGDNAWENYIDNLFKNVA